METCARRGNVRFSNNFSKNMENIMVASYFILFLFVLSLQPFSKSFLERIRTLPCQRGVHFLEVEWNLFVKSANEAATKTHLRFWLENWKQRDTAELCYIEEMARFTFSKKFGILSDFVKKRKKEKYIFCY